MARQTLDELSEKATVGQLKHLATHPGSTYACSVQHGSSNSDAESRDDDPAILVTNNRIRPFTWGQIQILRRSVNVPKKALSVLKRRSPG